MQFRKHLPRLDDETAARIAFYECSWPELTVPETDLDFEGKNDGITNTDNGIITKIIAVFEVGGQSKDCRWKVAVCSLLVPFATAVSANLFVSIG